MTAVLDRLGNLWVVDGSELPLGSLACKENSDDIRNSTETRWGRGEGRGWFDPMNRSSLWLSQAWYERALLNPVNGHPAVTKRFKMSLE